MSFLSFCNHYKPVLFHKLTYINFHLSHLSVYLFNFYFTHAYHEKFHSNKAVPILGLLFDLPQSLYNTFSKQVYLIFSNKKFLRPQNVNLSKLSVYELPVLARNSEGLLFQHCCSRLTLGLRVKAIRVRTSHCRDSRPKSSLHSLSPGKLKNFRSDVIGWITTGELQRANLSSGKEIKINLLRLKMMSSHLLLGNWSSLGDPAKAWRTQGVCHAMYGAHTMWSLVFWRAFDLKCWAVESNMQQ